jgi:hypothetical protein
VPQYFLQIRLKGQPWRTTTVAATRAGAASGTKNAVLEMTARGHLTVGIRVISDTELRRADDGTE